MVKKKKKREREKERERKKKKEEGLKEAEKTGWRIGSKRKVNKGSGQNQKQVKIDASTNTVIHSCTRSFSNLI